MLVSNDSAWPGAHINPLGAASVTRSAIEIADQNGGYLRTSRGSVPITKRDRIIGYTATLLQNGQVLVAGGAELANQAVILPSAELYNPATGTWSATGSMTTARTGHTATLLPNGQVLVAGSEGSCVNGSCPPLASAELYNPATGTWAPTCSMTTARTQHTATLLPNGQVLVAGGGC